MVLTYRYCWITQPGDSNLLTCGTDKGIKACVRAVSDQRTEFGPMSVNVAPFSSKYTWCVVGGVTSRSKWNASPDVHMIECKHPYVDHRIAGAPVGGTRLGRVIERASTSSCMHAWTSERKT